MNIEFKFFCTCGTALTATPLGPETYEISVEPCATCRDKARLAGIEAAAAEIESLRKRRGLPF
jgi:hypothetical protein